MSSMEEWKTDASARGKKTLLSRLGSISIRWKVRIAYLAGILLSACIVILMVSLFQRKAAVRNAYDKVYLLRTAKARLVETYFERLSEKIRIISASQQTLDMHAQLSESFMNIESDNYATPGAGTPEQIGQLVEGYYTTEILPLLESRMDKKIPLTSLIPQDNRQQILQYLYIVGNNKPAGLKYSFNKAADGSSYSGLHSGYHPAMVQYVREAGISDILLVDYKSGYVVYSVKKNLDFATNLYEGPYKNTTLGMAFKSAIGLPSAGSFQITDEALYAPALLKPTFFISAPLISGSEIKGAIIFAMDASILDQLLAQENNDLMGESGLKSFIVGDDLFYRNNDPDMLTNPDRYVRRLKRFAPDGAVSLKADRLRTTAMVQPLDDLVFQDGIHGKERLTEYSTSTGKHVLCSYGPVTIPGLKWILVSQLDKNEALRPVHRLTWYLGILTGLLVLMAYLVVHVLSDRMASGFRGLGDFLHTLAIGGKPERPEVMHADELGHSVNAASLLSDRLNRATSFIDDLGKGNIDLEFEQLGAGDRLGISLNNLKNSLLQNRDQATVRKQEEEIRNWSAQGIALFNDIIRMDNDNLQKLSMNIIRNIIQYLNANQGGLFLIEEDEGTQYLELVAAYAFDRHKFQKKRIGIGEGLAGTCVLEKKTILLSRIPEEYIEITSGLGGAKPGCLLIVPLKKGEEILGVLEMASFNPFKPHEVEFVEKVAESIASALITVRLHLQTTEYLERFQQQAEEMKAQDEELRQNIEELQATHEQMEKLKQEENERNEQMIREIQEKQKELEEEKALLDTLLSNVPECIYFKDEKSRFIRFSKSMLDLFGLKTADELMGKTDFDFFDEEHARPAFEDEQNIIRTGIAIVDKEEKEVMDDGRVSWVNTTKMPMLDSQGNVIGTFGISKNISHLKKLEREALESNKTIENNRKLLIDILDKIPAKIFLKDEKGIFVVVNSAVASIYNKPAEQIIGTTDYDNHPDEDVDAWRAQELDIIKHGKKTYVHQEKSKGKTRFLDTTKIPFKLATTGNTGLLGIQFDITEMKRLEEQVVELKMELERLKKM